MFGKIRAFARKLFELMPGVKRIFAFIMEHFPTKLRWKIAQSAEFQFHQQDRLRQQERAFLDHSKKILEGFGYKKTDMLHKTIVDIGAGSRLMGRYFDEAKIIAIEPLADKFLKNIPWTDLHMASRVYSTPAETFISELENGADFIMCINVLDHTRDPLAVLKNCFRYLNTDGSMLLSVDLHKDYAGLEHPVHFKDPDVVRECCIASGFKIAKEFHTLPQIGVSAYGGGVAYSAILKKQ